VNFLEPFIRRPVATTLISIGVVLAGLAAYSRLPVSPLPQVDIPVITVTANLPGASPEVMASSVATPLERHFGTIANVTDIFSQSSVGFTSIAVIFDLERNIDGAARDVEAAINGARADLAAAGLRSNPIYRKIDPSAQPVLSLALTSDTLTQGQLYDAASTVLAQTISQVPGVGSVVVAGSSLPAVRIELNPLALFKYGIGLENVRAALAAANANSPKGAIEDGTFHWQILSNDQAETAAEYRELIVAFRNGAPVRLSNVANVLDSVEDTRNYGVADGRQAVILSVSRQPGANIIDTVDRVRALLPQLQASISAAAHLAVAVDMSVMIRSSLRDAEFSLIMAVILVVLVVYAFLGNGRATLIPGAAVPLSVIGTFAAMYLLHYSLNSMTLIALTIATGFVVDDAIVVMENTVRHIEAGVPRFRAALRGVQEVGFTVLSMSLSLIAVFSPILLMGGIAGRFFHEFAATLSIAIVISMVVSLTTTPMMCARLLRQTTVVTRGRFARWSEGRYEKLLAGYARSLRWALRHRLLVLCVLIGTVGLNFVLFGSMRKGFFPLEDTGILAGSLQAEQSISPQRLVTKLKQYVQIITADPAIATVVGITGNGGANTAQLSIRLKPLAERKISSEAVIARLRPQLAHVAGATLFLRSIQSLGGGGGAQQGNSLYQYSIQGDDLTAVKVWTDKLVTALKNEPALLDVNSDQQDKGLTTELAIDRDMASRFGLSSAQVDSTLYDAFGQRLVSTIYKSLNQYHVVMVVQPQFRENPAVLRDLYVSSAGGVITGTQASNATAGTVQVGRVGAASSSAIAADTARNAALNSIATTGKGAASTAQAVSTAQSGMIPLGAFTRYDGGTTPLSVNHRNLFVTRTIGFNLAPGASLSDALAAITRQSNLIHMPVSLLGGFQGNEANFQKIFGNLPVLLLAALLSIYIVLGILYESYAHPFTILSTLPSAGVGAFLALMLCRTELSLVAILGLFLLIGIVKKNAIMMIDLAIVLERTDGMSPAEAIFEASRLRFRPIMMTTAAALLAALPLAIGFGSGAEFRRPLGISIIGGLIVSQLLTLYTTPVVYLYVDRISRWWVGRRAALSGFLRRRWKKISI